MSDWRIRSPDRFPPEFLWAVRTAYQEWLLNPGKQTEKYEIGRRPRRNSIDNLADKFYCFKACLRAYPMHPLHRVEANLHIKLNTREATNEWVAEISIQEKPGTKELERALIA